MAWFYACSRPSGVMEITQKCYFLSLWLQNHIVVESCSLRVTLSTRKEVGWPTVGGAGGHRLVLKHSRKAISVYSSVHPVCAVGYFSKRKTVSTVFVRQTECSEMFRGRSNCEMRLEMRASQDTVRPWNSQ